MGYSLGSVPSVHISSVKNLKCLILIAPIASGIKTIKPLSSYTNIPINELEKIDVFCNLSKIADINCPIFLIHGKMDDVITISHSYEILKKVKNPNTWFPGKGNHQNIFTNYRRKFYEKINTFFDKVNIFHNHDKETNDSITNFNDEDINAIQSQIHKQKASCSLYSDKQSMKFKLFKLTAKPNRQENDLALYNDYDENLAYKDSGEIGNETPSFKELTCKSRTYK